MILKTRTKKNISLWRTAAVALLCCMLLVLSFSGLAISGLTPLNVLTSYAQSRAVNAYGFAGGDGSSNDPFLIETPEQLDNMRQYGFPWSEEYGALMPSYYFKLTTDIDLTQYLSSGNGGYNDGKGWEPIGTFAEPFTGFFYSDGNYTISGLWINRPTEKYVGLFGRIFDAKIENINIELSERGITGLSFLGGIAGMFGTMYMNKPAANIIGCSVIGSLTASLTYDSYKPVTAYAGLIAGNVFFATVTGCYANGTVTGLSGIGGIAGVAEGADIIDCYFKGGIKPTAPAEWEIACAGGITGTVYNDSKIKNTFYCADIVYDARVAAIAGFNGFISSYGTPVPLSSPVIYSCYYNIEGFSNPLHFLRLADDYDDEEYDPEVLRIENCKGLTNKEMKNKANYVGWDFENAWGFDKDGNLILQAFGEIYFPPSLMWLWATLGCLAFGVATVASGLILYRRKKTKTVIVKEVETRIETVEIVREIEKEVIKEVPLIKKPLPVDLSEQERRVAELVLRGKSLKVIADELGLTKNTIQTYMERVYTKAGVAGQKEFITYYTFDN